MRGGKAGLGLTAGIVLALAGLVLWAWHDAGREPVGRIAVPVAVPAIQPELAR